MNWDWTDDFNTFVLDDFMFIEMINGDSKKIIQFSNDTEIYVYVLVSIVSLKEIELNCEH